MSNDLNYINVGKLIFDFENEKSASLAHLKLHKREAWSVVKVHFYFGILYSSLSKKNAQFNNNSVRPWTAVLKSYLSYAKHFLGFSFKFLGLVFTRSGENLLWFVPMSCDKLLKNEKGEYINVLVDQLVKSADRSKRMIIEIPNNFDYKDPSDVKRDLGTVGLLIPYRLLYLLIKFSNCHRSKATKVADSLRDYFKEKSIDYSIDASELKKYMDSFSAEYYVYTFLLFFIKPKAVFTVDQAAAGKIAAFLNKKVSVIEIQHGMLEEYNPPYVYPESIRTRRDHLVIPDKVCVFGEYHGKVLLRYGYWRRDDLIYLGNYRLDYWRKKNNKERSSRFHILFPTQWHVFEETKIALKEIISHCENTILDIKLHPGEKENHVLYYHELQKNYPDTVRLWDKNKDIYELITTSDLIIGYDSTTMLEGLALGKPAISIPTEAATEGIHTYMNTEDLKEAIKVARDKNDLGMYIQKMKNDPDYRSKWEKEASVLGEYLYSNDYEKNCLDLITSLTQ